MDARAHLSGHSSNNLHQLGDVPACDVLFDTNAAVELYVLLNLEHTMIQYNVCYVAANMHFVCSRCGIVLRI